VDPELHAAYVENAFEHLLRVAERVGPRLHDRPVGEGTTSVGALVLHCAELCEFWLGHLALGRPSSRDRDAEFLATPSLEELRARVARARSQAAHDLREVAAGRGGHPSELRVFALGDGSDEDLAMYVLKELHQHLGHAELSADVFAQQLYHLALADEWEQTVERGGPYLRSTVDETLDQVGFIHCSFLHQLAATRGRFYAGREDVVLLCIEPGRLDVEVRVEDLHGHGEVFPHVYGPLPLTAVVEARPLGAWPDADG
jgi:uncharacterized protein (DUF952 family)